MRHDYTQSTAEAYIHALEEFATYFHRSPDKLEVSQFQPDLLKQRKPACFERHRIRASGPVRSTSLLRRHATAFTTGLDGLRYR